MFFYLLRNTVFCFCPTIFDHSLSTGPTLNTARHKDFFEEYMMYRVQIIIVVHVQNLRPSLLLSSKKSSDIMVRWSYMVGGFNLIRGSILVTYLSGINNTIFNKISFYSTKLQYTNII